MLFYGGKGHGLTALLPLPRGSAVPYIVRVIQKPVGSKCDLPRKGQIVFLQGSCSLIGQGKEKCWDASCCFSCESYLHIFASLVLQIYNYIYIRQRDRQRGMVHLCGFICTEEQMWASSGAEETRAGSATTALHSKGHLNSCAVITLAQQYSTWDTSTGHHITLEGYILTVRLRSDPPFAAVHWHKAWYLTSATQASRGSLFLWFCSRGAFLYNLNWTQ